VARHRRVPRGGRVVAARPAVHVSSKRSSSVGARSVEVTGDSRQTCRDRASHPTFMSPKAKPPDRDIPENPLNSWEHAA
jgi:hypothetical protein